jgi:hypothetical protein
MDEYEVLSKTLFWREKHYTEFVKQWFETNDIEYKIFTDREHNEPFCTYTYQNHKFEIHLSGSSHFGGIYSTEFHVNSEEFDIYRISGKGFEDQLIQSIYQVNQLYKEEIYTIDNVFEIDLKKEYVEDDNYFHVNLYHYSSNYLFIDKDNTKRIADLMDVEDIDTIFSGTSEVLQTSPGAVCGVDWSYSPKNKNFLGEHISGYDTPCGISVISDFQSIVHSRFLAFAHKYIRVSNKNYFYVLINEKVFRIENFDIPNRFELNHYNVRVYECMKEEEGLFGDKELSKKEFSLFLNENLKTELKFKIINDSLSHKLLTKYNVDNEKLKKTYLDLNENVDICQFNIFDTNNIHVKFRTKEYDEDLICLDLFGDNIFTNLQYYLGNFAYTYNAYRFSRYGSYMDDYYYGFTIHYEKTHNPDNGKYRIEYSDEDIFNEKLETINCSEMTLYNFNIIEKFKIKEVKEKQLEEERIEELKKDKVKSVLSTLSEEDRKIIELELKK